MFRVVWMVCLISLAAISVSFLVSPEASRPDFIYANSSDLNTLDPAQMSWTKDIRVAINLWEGLTSYHPQTTAPVEGAADFPPQVSPDGLTYVFTLRSDGRWSNGDGVTSGDFVRAGGGPWSRGQRGITSASSSTMSQARGNTTNGATGVSRC